MATEVLASSGSDIRENLVTTAVKFLSNPNVQRCTMESKERFLRGKGLSEIEIQKALEQCADFVDLPSLASDFMFFNQPRKSWFKDRILPVIVYGGFAYGCYWFYKNWIKQMIFVEDTENKTTVECLDEVRHSLNVLNASVSSLRGDVQANLHMQPFRFQFENLKADIASIKGLLVNRNQFPSLKGRTEPPSIPAWQRQSVEATSTEVAAEEKKKQHRSRSQRSESGGSNSSEGEQATKNSDSSLEIIT